MVLFVFSTGRNEISTSSLITFWFCKCKCKCKCRDWEDKHTCPLNIAFCSGLGHQHTKGADGSVLLEVKSKNINNFTYRPVTWRPLPGINAAPVIPLIAPKLKLSCLIIILTPPWHDSTCHTNLCIAPHPEKGGHFVYWKITSSQALILLKIAPAARTYGLHLCSEELFIFFRLFLFRMWWKENSDNIHKVPIQGDVFHFPKNAFKHY